jgi:hypothetical protein
MKFLAFYSARTQKRSAGQSLTAKLKQMLLNLIYSVVIKQVIVTTGSDGYEVIITIHVTGFIMF